MDIAIVKATNHEETPAKEKYIRGNKFCFLCTRTVILIEG